MTVLMNHLTFKEAKEENFGCARNISPLISLHICSQPTELLISKSSPPESTLHRRCRGVLAVAKLLPCKSIAVESGVFPCCRFIEVADRCTLSRSLAVEGYTDCCPAKRGVPALLPRDKSRCLKTSSWLRSWSPFAVPVGLSLFWKYMKLQPYVGQN